VNADSTIIEDCNKPIEKPRLIWTFDRNISIVQTPQPNTNTQHRIHGSNLEVLVYAAERYKTLSNFIRLQWPTGLLQKRYDCLTHVNTGHIIASIDFFPNHSTQSFKIARFSESNINDVLIDGFSRKIGRIAFN